MGLTSQLIPALVCFLACTTSHFTRGHKYNNITLEEIITTLNTLTERMAKDQKCMELTVADVFADAQNTTEKKTFCRVGLVLRQIYRHHQCATNRYLFQLDRNVYSMTNTTQCHLNEAKKSTLKDLLERLTRIMKEKYSKG